MPLKLKNTPIYPSKKWVSANNVWRQKALEQIKQWIKTHNEPYDKATHNVVIKRFQKLESFIYRYFPAAPPAPFDYEDAAALIILPRNKALKLARILFHNGISNLETSDLIFNLDWFNP